MTKVAVLTVLLALAGCAGPAREVTYAPAQATSQVQTDGDVHACVTAAQGQKDQNLAFAACLMERGYRASVQLGNRIGFGGEPMVSVNVRRAAEQRAPAIYADLADCQQQARVRASERATVIASSSLGPLGRLYGWGTVAERITTRFQSCVTARHYEVTPWEGYR